MKITAFKILPQLKKGDTVIAFVAKDVASGRLFPLDTTIAPLAAMADVSSFKARASELFYFAPINGPQLILCGLGDSRKVDAETIRNASSSIVAACREKNITSFHLICPPIQGAPADDALRACAEGLHLSNYGFDRYRNIPADEAKPLITKVTIITTIKNTATILGETDIVCANTLACRDLINETSERSNPLTIAARAKALSSIKGVTCKVYGKKELEKMEMGLLLAVNKGSAIPPRLVILSYKGDPASKKSIALVGKGLTFDSGGVNLKPSGHIETMRMDMAGAAAVMYALKSAAELRLKANIHAVMPLTENMISNDAYRPGDIFTAYNGKTVEIGNTDAEGRLILADALAYTVKKLKPDYIVDLATLTGACIVAFGETVAAFLSNDDALKTLLVQASARTDEKIWELPLYPEYDENMRSEIADISNVSAEKNAGAIMGAVFLKNFIGDAKWAHVDIAGTAWYSKQRGYRPKNATGFGVRLLVELVRAWRN